MDEPTVWVGVDVSKEQLAVALRPSGEQFSLANDGHAAALTGQAVGAAELCTDRGRGYRRL